MNIFIIISVCLCILCALFKTNHGIVCNNTDIRNSFKDLHKLNNCTEVNGFVRIVLIEERTDSGLINVSFPHLTEIFDYLLIYRVSKLRSLERLFPNLKYIRGRKLFHSYSLVINDLPDLERIGLNQIEYIRGGVRIEGNPKLCFATTNDYKLISKAIKPNSSNSLSRQKSSSTSSNITVRPLSDSSVSIEWNPTQKYSVENTTTYYTISVIQIEDITNLIDQQNYCNNSFVAKYNPNSSICRNQNKAQNLVLSYVELDFVNEDEFLNRLIDDIYIKRGQENNLVNGIEPKSSSNSAKLSTAHQMIRSYDYRVEANKRRANLTTLAHFTSYFIKISRCKDFSVLSGVKKNRAAQCDLIGIKKTKTFRNTTADNIDESSIRYSFDNNSVLIEWKEPKRPNGFIVSYNIEYQELLNKTVFRFCINRLEYLENNKSYRIYNLTCSVRHSFRLRANSIAGSGSWTNYFNFTVPPSGDHENDFLETPVGENYDKMLYLTILLTLISSVFVLIAFLCYLKFPSKEGGFMDVISMNPEYKNFIVDPEWEIDRSFIRLIKILGIGAFGRVYAGELKVNNQITRCAVKTLNPDARSAERENFLKEANIMKSFVDCHHIVKLIGIVSIGNPVLVLMEYMANGDLKTYLRSNRPDNDENPNACVPTLKRILQMAIEISDGMSYLASRKFVHRDLAARNCMVSADLTVKIGDFGMTRDIYDCDYYRKRDCGLIPVRWMSPESLRDGVFTTNSDIWSYGVVLWEMVTLGSQPYQGLSNEYVYKYVVGGGIMKQPENCPKKLWKIMSSCWRKNPKLRPTFPEIVEMLLPSANQRFREVSFHLNHKPFITKHQSLKRIWDNLSTPLKQVNKLLLNGEKPVDYNDNTEDVHYYPMNPTILSKGVKLNDEIKQLKSLSQMNSIRNLKNNEESNESEITKCLSNDNKENKVIEDEVCQEWHYKM